MKAPAGVRLLYGPSLALPVLDDVAMQPFASTGDFRPGLGIRLGIGYRLRGFEANATADYSGIEVGEPFEVDGIGMGRRTSILRAYGLELRWGPQDLNVGGWFPAFSVGYIAGGVDNLLVSPGQLPEDLAALAQSVGTGDEAQRTGISGSGVRFGVAGEKNLGATLAARVQLEGDFLSFDEFIFGETRWPWDGGTGSAPRALVELRWAP